MTESSAATLNTRPWALAVTKVLAFAEEQGARIVGITGDRAGVGVSTLSRELAQAYSRHGLRAILVDASHLDQSSDAQAIGETARVSLHDIATPVSPDVSMVDLAPFAGQVPASSAEMAEWLKAEVSDNVAIVVDLPAVRDDKPSQVGALRTVGSACEIVYLVCLSGVTTEAELSQCIESCKIHRVPIGGLIINDWKQIFASLTSGL